MTELEELQAEHEALCDVHADLRRRHAELHRYATVLELALVEALVPAQRPRP